MEVEQIHQDEKMLDPDATVEEMEPEGHKVHQVDHIAKQHLYDPSHLTSVHPRRSYTRTGVLDWAP